MAQTAPASNPSDDFTRELNGGPPYVAAPATAPVTPPVTSPAVQPTATPARTTTPTAQPPATVQPRPTPPATQPRIEPRPQPAVAPPASTPVVTPPAPTPAAVETVAEPAPPPPTVTVLDAAALSALPFRIELPAGFQITTGRPAPDFKVYSVERAGEPFVMIYTGPSAIFPIYEGDQVEAAGRTSVLVTEDGRRRAQEHLFQRDAPPRQIHVWVASVEAADRDQAEAIAQSVDPR